MTFFFLPYLIFNCICLPVITLSWHKAVSGQVGLS